MGGGSSKTALDGGCAHWSVRVMVGQEDHTFRCSDSHQLVEDTMDKIVRTIHDEATESAPNDDGSEFPVKVRLIFSGGYTSGLFSALSRRIYAIFLASNGLSIVRPLAIDMSIMGESRLVAETQLGGIGGRLVDNARHAGISATVRYVSNNGT